MQNSKADELRLFVDERVPVAGSELLDFDLHF
jgi:hypothetical protein